MPFRGDIKNEIERLTEGVKVGRQLRSLILAAPKGQAMVDETKPAGKVVKKSGGIFFSLIDECAASERRLDETAAPLLQELQETEAEAVEAVTARRTRLQAARDYIKRMKSAAEELSGDNGGPTVTEESEASSDSSGAAKTS